MCLPFLPFLALSAMSPLAAPPRYTLTDLGAVPDFARIFGAAVNEGGAVVGVATRSFLYPNGGGGTQTRSFLRTGANQREILIFDGNVTAWDINSAGQVVGTADLQSEIRAFIWRDGEITVLPPVGGSWSWGFSINDAGQVAGGSYVDPYDGVYRATRWDADGSILDLGSLRPGGTSNSSSLNSRGEVVGWTDTNLFHVAFHWHDGQMHALPRPGGPSSYRSTVARDINDNGVIVGYNDLQGDLGYEPLRWTAGGVETLPLPPGRPIGRTEAINNAGLIVGRATSDLYDIGEYRAILWERGTVVDLNTLIPAGSGVLLTDAAEISDTGSIVARGLVDGVLHGFVLTPTLRPTR